MKKYELTFRSIVKDGKDYTRDGKHKVTYPYYSRTITSLTMLTPEEIDYVLNDYVRLKAAIRLLNS